MTSPAGRPDPKLLGRLLEVDAATAEAVASHLEAAERAAADQAPAASQAGRALARPSDTSGIERALRSAAEILRAARDGLDRCDSLSAILEAVHTFGSDSLGSFAFTPEEGIEVPADAPPCPEAGHRYDGLSDTSMPRELVWLEGGELPAGAVLPVLRTLSLPEPETAGGEDEEPDVDRIVRRYGPELLGCMLEVLSDPWRYTLTEPTRSMDVLRDRALSLVRFWPEDALLAVYRAAVRAGWHHVVEYAPEGRATRELEREVARSPYRSRGEGADARTWERPHPRLPRMVAVPARQGALVFQADPVRGRVDLFVEDASARERGVVLPVDSWRRLRAAFRTADLWIREGLRPGTSRRVDEVTGLVAVEVRAESDGNWWIRVEVRPEDARPGEVAVMDVQASQLPELRQALITIDRAT